MSLDSILNHILSEANTQRDRIIEDAKKEADKFIQEAKLQAELIYQEFMDKEGQLYLAQKQKLIVNARLEAKKNKLKAKQELIDSVFENLKSNLKKDKFKKQQVLQDKVKEVGLEDIDFYLSKVRPDYEIEIARILFE